MNPLDVPPLLLGPTPPELCSEQAEASSKAEIAITDFLIMPKSYPIPGFLRGGATTILKTVQDLRFA